MSPSIHADVRLHRGAPALHFDGRAQPATAYKITETSNTDDMLASAEAEIPGLARRGIRQCWVPVFIEWTGPGEYHFSDLDRRISTVLRLYDEHTPADQEPAAIVVRLQAAIFSPPWYIDRHLNASGQPTNLVEFRTPWGPAEPEPVDQARRFATRRSAYDSTYAISPGDRFWDTHAIDCITAIVRHVQEQPWADRVFGWLPCAFSTNEWFLHSDATEATCDHSAPAQEAFGRYLDARGIPHGPDPVPSPTACQRGDTFLNPADDKDRIVKAFSRWINQRMVQIIGRLARTIREHYGPTRKLVGVFYGYTTELSPIHHLAQSGHLGLRELLNNPDIDFLCSPGQYRYRGDEGPFTYSQVLGAFANSCALHGKLAFLEDDHRPAALPAVSTAASTRDAWHDEMFFRRNLGQVLTHGQALWWYSLSPKWLSNPARQEVVGRLHRVALEALNRDRAPVAEVAVVADERSVIAMRLNPQLQRSLLLRSCANCHTLGAPFEFYELSSFLRHPDIRRFKLVLFLNLFVVDDATQAAMERLKADGRTLIFAVAPGYLRESPAGRVASIAAAGAMAGMALREETDVQPLNVWIDPDRTDLLPGDMDVRYGWFEANQAFQPILSVADAAAEPLGWLYSGNVGLARRRHPDWTAVFSAAPEIPADVLRQFCKDAGVHVYADGGDVVYANRSLLAMVASSRGRKRLTLPNNVRLRDALSGESIALDSGRACEFPMRRHETRLFWQEK